MGRLAVVVLLYVGLAVTLGALYSWIWPAFIALFGVIAGVALVLAAGKGGELLADLSRQMYERRYGGRR